MPAGVDQTQGELAVAVAEGKIGPPGEHHVEPAVLTRCDGPDLSVGERHVFWLPLRTIEGLAALVADLDHLVTHDDVLVAETDSSPLADVAQLLAAEEPLYPPVYLVHAVGVHTHRGENLEALHAVRFLKIDVAVLVEPEKAVETVDVAVVREVQVLSELLHQPRPKIVWGLPEGD